MWSSQIDRSIDDIDGFANGGYVDTKTKCQNRIPSIPRYIGDISRFRNIPNGPNGWLTCKNLFEWLVHVGSACHLQLLKRWPNLLGLQTGCWAFWSCAQPVWPLACCQPASVSPGPSPSSIHFWMTFRSTTLRSHPRMNPNELDG